MNIFQFMAESPFLAFFLAVIIFLLVKMIVSWPFVVISRMIRHRTIVARGWPPVHLDANGDFKPISETE